jgi:hypothetical protein
MKNEEWNSQEFHSSFFYAIYKDCVKQGMMQCRGNRKGCPKTCLAGCSKHGLVELGQGHYKDTTVALAFMNNH